MNLWLVFAFLFFIGSCSGWCLELVYRRFISKNNPSRKWINPGFLVGPCVPLYGFGLLTVFVTAYLTIPAVRRVGLTRWQEIALVFVAAMILMTLIEYIAGKIFVIGMNIKLWDYSREKFNVQGVICPKFSIYWGLIATAYYLIVHSHVVSWVNWLAENLAFSFFIGVFFGFFIIDCVYSMQLSIKIRTFAKKHDIIVRYEELKELIADRREYLEEKKQFLLSFNTREPMKQYMEAYVERKIRKQKEKIREIKEEIKDDIRENFEELKENFDELRDNIDEMKKEYYEPAGEAGDDGSTGNTHNADNTDDTESTNNKL